LKLSDSIKQTSFKSELNKALLNIIYTASNINAIQSRFFKSFDISPQQYNVLRILRGQHPVAANMGLVQERMLDQNSNASRLVDKLFQKKLVKRTACKTDRRQVDIFITQTGLNMLRKIDKLLVEMESSMMQLTEAEFKQLNNLLDKLNKTEK